MKNTALITAFMVVCIGPPTVVAMTNRPLPPARTYFVRTAETTPAQNTTTPEAAAEADRQARTDTEVVTTDMYVTQAAVADLFELESSKLALEKSQNAEVKRFAQMMVDDHTKSTESLKIAAGSVSGPNAVPESMDLQHEGLLDDLKAAKAGAAFDRAYLETQVSGHQDALKLHRSYSEQGDNAALKTHATTSVPIITAHLDEAEKIASAVKGM